MDIIYTDRLVIREFTQVDIDKVFPLLSDPIVMKHLFWSFGYNRCTKMVEYNY